MSAAGSKAVVLLSGGLDSATALAIAREAGHDCYAMTVFYGQRHDAEIAAARRVAASLGAREHTVVRVDLAAIGASALTDTSIAVPEAPATGIPVTYVPARNTVLLSLALGWAETLDAGHIYIGVNAVDYSGYPDCRPAFINAFQQLARVATKAAVEGRAPIIHAPLLEMSKAGIVSLGTRLGLDYAMTVSCYQADNDGAACGRCDACRLRREGFSAAGLTDPTRYQP